MPKDIRKRPILRGEDAKRFLQAEKENDQAIDNLIEKLIKLKRIPGKNNNK